MPVKFKQDFRETKEVTLPVSGATVTVFDGFMADQIDKIQKMSNPTTSMILKMIIKQWDFVDDQEQPLPVEESYIGKLHIKDVMSIVSEAGLEDFLEEAQALQTRKASTATTS